MLPLFTYHQTVPISNWQSTPDTELRLEGFPSHDQPSAKRIYQRDARPIDTDSYNRFSSGRIREHQLRRKTPNGTVEAGYDGSPANCITGEPPLKQLVVADSAVDKYDTNALTAQNYSRNHMIDECASNLEPRNAPWQPHLLIGTPLRPQGLNRAAYQAVSQNCGLGFFNGFQPVIRANEYNVRAFCPPPPTNVGGLPLGQLGWHPEPFLREYQSVVDANANQRGVHPQLLAQKNTEKMLASVSSEFNHVTSITPHNPEPTCENDYHANPEICCNHLAFREKTILQAYRSYACLVGYIQAHARASTDKDSAGNASSSSRHLIFPKPPRPRRGSAIRPQSSKQAAASMAISETVSLSGDFNVSATQQNQQFLPPYRRHVIFAGVDQFRPRQPVTGGAIPWSAPIVGTDNNKPFPISDAKLSTDVLKSLCEHSHWTWIEGILILGCLQYALQQYSEALGCFSRITASDHSHIEAIANMAACLYSLNRHEEAEKYWLLAVQQQPSYLEAVEHLVGLLYKKRGKQAIDIICYVQNALGVSTNPQVQVTNYSQLNRTISTSHSTCKSLPDGYGSSGYTLPGADNGRMLALIHAKGTMLYGLKDIDGAARAFEEAVLISVGRSVQDIRELVREIQNSLSQTTQQVISPQPFLLSPDKARGTAQLLFGGNGDLPGLKWVTDLAPRKAAVQTTSNSLLSLAKIFQDSMTSDAFGHALTRPTSGVADILALYYLSLSLQESPSTANNVGILLAGIPETQRYKNVTSMPHFQPTVPGVVPGSGMALALAYYYYGLRLDPKHVHLHTNLGSLLKDVGQLELAIQMYERAVACDGAFDIALTNLANAVKDKGRISDAIGYYRRAVIANPNFAEAVCGLFTALNSVCDWKGRGGVFLYSGKYDRWHVNDNGHLVDAETTRTGTGLSKRVADIVRQQLDDASQWGRNALDDTVIERLSHDLSNLAHNRQLELSPVLQQWRGSRWSASRLVRILERAAKIMLRCWYRDQYILRKETVSPCVRLRLPATLSVPSAPTVLPFHTFTSPLTAREVRVISQRNAMRISCATLRATWLPDTILPPPAPPRPNLNVGYVSSDFNNHPLAHLMQSVFGLHDQRRVRAFCYATTPSDKSKYREKIEKEAPVFRDVSSWTPKRLIQQISDDGIHILVNLNGYTRGARNEIFAARPAPIQMSFMGFAGTLGAEWCDYILADTTAIPPDTLRPWRQNETLEDVLRDDSESDQGDWIYTENIIFCRDTFFCCDHAQSASPSERHMTWAGEQSRRRLMRKELFPNLPDNTVILANFNQLYKIDPSTFRSWLRILAHVPNAVLWLLRFPEVGEANLRRTAKLWAGHEVANRLIFTDVAQKSQHISRARICDLFLDTPECNAHTTAADVLWSSTPLLTYPRYPYKMCSRMAASILKGALPKSVEGRKAAEELITTSEESYEKAAIKLASNLTFSITASGQMEETGRLVEIRQLLWESKWTCGLFNTRRWVRDVESAYEEAWRRWETGKGGDIYL